MQERRQLLRRGWVREVCARRGARDLDKRQLGFLHRALGQQPDAVCSAEGLHQFASFLLGPPVRAKLGGLEADAVAQGCVVPWALPLLDAWRALRAADHFLYVAVRPHR